MKYLQCSNCIHEERVDEKTGKVLCWRCVQKAIPPPKSATPLIKSDRPRGWHLYDVFVDKDGNVFHKGEEKPKLKNTLPPTVIKEIKKKSSLEKITEEEKKEQKLANEYKRKKRNRKNTTSNRK